MSAMDNLVLRIIDPSRSGLPVLGSYGGGHTPDQVIKAALDEALTNLAQQYGTANPPAPTDLAKFTRVHPRSQLCSLSGVVGPGSSTLPGTSCVTMPFEDRGTWAQLVGFEKP
jgi:penicillin amidase